MLLINLSEISSDTDEKKISGCSVARSSRLLWEQEVAGSNPATPTKTSLKRLVFYLCLTSFTF